VTVTGVSSGYVGFGMSSLNPIQYYATHYHQDKIFVFDEDWNYVSNKSSFPEVYYMIPGANYSYITGDDNIWKTDQQFKVLIGKGSITDYRGLYQNSKNDLIYVAIETLQVIYVFNLKFKLKT